MITPITTKWLIDSHVVLDEVAKAILQTDKGVVEKIVDAAVAKGSAAAGMASIVALIGTYGTASTGTAIGTLSGAAASSATLFWIGSLVGGGAIAGGGILAATAVLLGFGGLKLKRKLTNDGRRTPENLSDDEKEILGAIEFFVQATKDEGNDERPLTEIEKFALLELWSDLLARFDIYLMHEAKAQLSMIHRLRARAACRKMRRLLNEVRQ